MLATLDVVVPIYEGTLFGYMGRAGQLSPTLFPHT